MILNFYYMNLFSVYLLSYLRMIMMTMITTIKITAKDDPTAAPTIAAGNSLEFSAKIKF